MLFYEFVALILVLLNTLFTVKTTLVLHVYIFSENLNKELERKTKMLHDISYLYVTGFITYHFILRHIHSFKISIF